MQLNAENSTICALATAPGIGAIGVIRLSGENAIDICNKSFKNKDLTTVGSHTIHFGTINSNEGKILDEVLVSVFKCPNSFTGENSVEISTHGSPYIQQQVIQQMIKNGAVAAKPGEFTMRAFLNGKMDLSQAEAVADVIASNSEASLELALKQMRGGFSNEIKDLRQELINFASLIELELDFSEEDVEFADRTQLYELIEKIQKTLVRLISSFDYGNVIKKGVPVAIIGEPNVGKSTLLNALLNEERAIVSDIAGTTRDSIEDEIVIKGVSFRFIDTAGIRETKDAIESIGILKTFEKVEEAKIIMYMVDASKISIDQLKTELLSINQKIEGKNKRLIIIANKIDNVDIVKTKEKFKEFESQIIFISAREKINVEVIEEKLYGYINSGALQNNDTVVTNSRHFEALTKANESLIEVLNGMNLSISGDLLAMDIRQALYYLGLITGEISSDDLLGNIFSKFCIGK